jgi:Mn2+/Fe2+ NRAMP family transporter
LNHSNAKNKTIVSHNSNIDTALPANKTSFFESLGPGILFAATSVGVSHLVQSTRAGAAYGLGLVVIILLAHAMKYSTFRAGSLYARDTGKSLIYAYRLQGKLPLALIGLVTLSSMSIALAGVTIVAAGLFQVTIFDSLSLSSTALLILVLAAAILLRGSYQWLEKASKYLVVFLTIVTIITTVVALPDIDLSVSGNFLPANWDIKTILFTIALVGWMPTTLDASIWQSLWTVEKSRSANVEQTSSTSSLDFHIGFFGTAILAVCFCLIGASIMHASDITFSNTAAGFASQLIDMYAATLGEWSRVVIGLCAIAVMFSTVLTVVDGYPRALFSIILSIKSDDEQVAELGTDSVITDTSHICIIMLHVSVAYILIFLWADSFKGLIDIAATVAFVSAPIIATFNHRAMCSAPISAENKLAGLSYYLSLVSILCLTVFSLVGLYFMVIG